LSTSLARHDYNNNKIAPLFATADDNDNNNSAGRTLFFASVVEDPTESRKPTETKQEPSATEATPKQDNQSNNDKPSSSSLSVKQQLLFDSSTLQEANDALTSVGWAGVAPMQGEGEMTSEDPFVKQIDESIMKEMGVGLDQLLNPAKVSEIIH